jgi:hypothetical protein
MTPGARLRRGGSFVGIAVAISILVSCGYSQARPDFERARSISPNAMPARPPRVTLAAYGAAGNTARQDGQLGSWTWVIGLRRVVHLDRQPSWPKAVSINGADHVTLTIEENAEPARVELRITRRPVNRYRHPRTMERHECRVGGGLCRLAHLESPGSQGYWTATISRLGHGAVTGTNPNCYLTLWGLWEFPHEGAASPARAGIADALWRFHLRLGGGG